MMENYYFRKWIFQSVRALLEANAMDTTQFEELSLTCAKNGVVDSQWGWKLYFRNEFDESMPHSMKVTTNKPTLH